ncbi:hypothetical protein FOBRF1_013504 [Fusarium oxysporum]
MAGEQREDQSFYYLLMEEPEEVVFEDAGARTTKILLSMFQVAWLDLESVLSSSSHDIYLSSKERRARASHNRVEKHYRNRLNAQFESLLNVSPAKTRQDGNGNGDDIESDGTNNPDRRVSKGEVLEMARKRIQAREREGNELQRENPELQGSLRRLKGSASDGTVSSSDGETPFNFNQCVQ